MKHYNKNKGTKPKYAIAVIATILPLIALGPTFQSQPSSASKQSDGYDHGCSDAKVGGHSYLNSPDKPSREDTAAYMNGYNDGQSACSSQAANDDGSDKIMYAHNLK
jgi:hypothetical protein